MSENPRPLLPLSHVWRAAIAVLLLSLAGLHLFLPTLAIDAIFLGLLAAALGILFFDVESFEWHGISVRRIQEKIQETGKIVEAVEIPAEPPATLEPPKPSEKPEFVIEDEGIVHRAPLELMPPVERVERLLWGAEQIRIELILIAGNSGHLKERVTWDQYSIRSLVRILAQSKILPAGLADSIVKTLDLRNEVVHPGRRLDPALVSASADLAMDVLNKLRSIKRQCIRIREPDVTMYKDRSLSVLHDTRGVMLTQLDETGKVLNISVYPRLQEYTKGRFVSWEWNMKRVFDSEGWYLDPGTSRAKAAWRQSATFAGREYPQQWGLEYYFSHPDVGLT